MNMIREIAERFDIKEGGRTLGEILSIHPDFKDTLEQLEQHWLRNANTVLTEIITEIRNRVTSPETTVGDLVKALDTISNKYSLHLGKPTSLTANVSLVKNLSDDELDRKLKELEAQVLSAPQYIYHAALPTVDFPIEDGTPPLPSSATSGEGSATAGRRRVVVIEEEVDTDFRPPQDTTDLLT